MKKNIYLLMISFIASQYALAITEAPTGALRCSGESEMGQVEVYFSNIEHFSGHPKNDLPFQGYELSNMQMKINGRELAKIDSPWAIDHFYYQGRYKKLEIIEFEPTVRKKSLHSLSISEEHYSECLFISTDRCIPVRTFSFHVETTDFEKINGNLSFTYKEKKQRKKDQIKITTDLSCVLETTKDKISNQDEKY